ncbi:MAG: DUF5131 family protein [Terriglobales bacterium]
MSDTSIEWTDKVWNPVTGCTKVSQGCKHCYAERVFPRAYAATGRKFTDVACHEDRLDQPLHWKKPARIFVNSMSDLFHESIPYKFIGRVFRTMHQANWHTYQILTKRPARMVDFVRWAMVEGNGNPEMYLDGVDDHIHLGFSAEDQKTFDERWATVSEWSWLFPLVWVSLEPLLGSVNCGTALHPGYVDGKHAPGIGWIVAGGESGPNARPMHPDWARSLRDQCQAAGVPFFFKQWGEWEPQRQSPGGTGFGNGQHHWPGESDCRMSFRVGKKAAGRMLDGREWNEYPEVRA